MGQEGDVGLYVMQNETGPAKDAPPTGWPPGERETCFASLRVATRRERDVGFE